MNWNLSAVEVFGVAGERGLFDHDREVGLDEQHITVDGQQLAFVRVERLVFTLAPPVRKPRRDFAGAAAMDGPNARIDR